MTSDMQSEGVEQEYSVLDDYDTDKVIELAGQVRNARYQQFLDSVDLPTAKQTADEWQQAFDTYANFAGYSDEEKNERRQQIDKKISRKLFIYQELEEPYQKHWAANQDKYESMDQGQVAQEMAEAKKQNDQVKFAVLDMVLSYKVEDFADQIKTERNPDGLPEGSREAIYAHLRDIIEENVTDQPKDRQKMVNNLSSSQISFMDAHPEVKKAYNNWLALLADGDRVAIAMAADELNYKMYDAVEEKGYKAALSKLYSSVQVEFKGSRVPTNKEVEQEAKSELKRKQRETAFIIGGTALTAIPLAILIARLLEDNT